MHIVQIAPYYPPYMGGQEVYIQQLSRELVRIGHRVTVLTSHFPGEMECETEEEDGITIHRFACLARPLRNPIIPGLFFNPHVPEDADLLHTHNIHSFPSNVACFLSRRYHLPLVITSHGQLVFGSKLPDAAVFLYSRTIGKATVRAADKIIVLTPSEGIRLVHETGVQPEKLVVVPGGLNIKEWDERRVLLQEQNIPPLFPGRKTILVATQLIKRKGIEYLIRAIAEVTHHFPNLILAIAGKGVEETKLKKLVEELGLQSAVTFLGRLSGLDLARAYQSADLFCLPSLGEGQPTCIMEAWTFSKPVIATQIEGVTDYFRKAALLVEPANSMALADSILRLLRDEPFCRDLGARGRALVDQFKLEKMAARVLQVYEEVMRA